MAIFCGTEPENMGPGNILRVFFGNVIEFPQNYIQDH